MAERARAAATVAALGAAALICGLVPGWGDPAAAGAASAPVVAVAQVDDGRLPTPESDPDDVRSSADDILARDDFAPPREGLVDRALGWVGERLGRLLAGGIGTGGDLVGWFLLVGLVALLTWLVRRLRPTAHRTTDAAPAPVVEVEEHRTAAEWAAAAADHEAAGRWLEALRCRYRALVAELVDHDAVRDVPGRTVGEYRVELATAYPSAAAPFEEATTIYEDAWYGHGPASADESHRFARRAGDVLGEVIA